MSMVPAPQRAERALVIDANPMVDSSRFEHMARIANLVAMSGLVPETIACEGSGNNKKTLPFEVVQARVFLVTNQAVRWGMDVFAVLSACSLVRGKLCYEGKLVAAVLDAKLGVALDYVWDDGQGDQAGITVVGTLPDGRKREIRGKVADWKTSGTGTPWTGPIANRRMLAYRGAREWVRMWAPAVLLGVYTPDELDDLQEAARDTRRARNGIAPPPPSPSIEHQPVPPVDTKVNNEPETGKAEPKPEPTRAETPKVEDRPAEETSRKKAPPPAAALPTEPDSADDQATAIEKLDGIMADWSNVAGSCESAEELATEATGFPELFGVDAPESIRIEAEKIRAAEGARIERQG